jgi:hypothetical protein
MGGPCPPQPDSLLGPGQFPSPNFQLTQFIFEPNHFPYKYPNNFIYFILPTYTAYEQSEGSETSVYKTQMPRYRPKERLQDE